MPDAEKVAEAKDVVAAWAEFVNSYKPGTPLFGLSKLMKLIDEALRKRERETEAKVWGEAADRHREYCTAITVNCCSQCKDFRRKAQEVAKEDGG